jgi:hypothetical protein
MAAPVPLSPAEPVSPVAPREMPAIERFGAEVSVVGKASAEEPAVSEAAERAEPVATASPDGKTTELADLEAPDATESLAVGGEAKGEGEDIGREEVRRSTAGWSTEEEGAEPSGVARRLRRWFRLGSGESLRTVADARRSVQEGQEKGVEEQRIAVLPGGRPDADEEEEVVVPIYLKTHQMKKGRLVLRLVLEVQGEAALGFFTDQGPEARWTGTEGAHREGP